MTRAAWMVAICVLPMLIGMEDLARGQGAAPPDYGFDWVTIGAPGNPPASEEEAPDFHQFWEPPLLVGDVDHEYRIMRVEVTVEQWFEFVEAFWPYWDGFYGDSALTGFWIYPDDPNPPPGCDPGFSFPPAAAKLPTTASWRVVARFCNWLHNGKINQQWAFMNGVYDVSTFGENEDDSLTDQAAHHPDALFWIPTLDEWTKAMHFDPDRYGRDEPGYWTMPAAQQEALLSGLPLEGGETDGGLNLSVDPPQNVDAYPWSTSPWGLLGGSGGRTELVEEMNGIGKQRLRKGSSAYDSFWFLHDEIDWLSTTLPDSDIGVRLASIAEIPCAADVNGDGALDMLDFIAFQTLFLTGDVLADFDADNELTIFDFVALQQAFAQGC